MMNKKLKLWCEGIDLRKQSNSEGIISIISDDEVDEFKHRGKKLKTSALKERNTKIEEMAGILKEKRGYDYNMVQYKVWVETLLNKRH